LLNVDLYFYFE